MINAVHRFQTDARVIQTRCATQPLSLSAHLYVGRCSFLQDKFRAREYASMVMKCERHSCTSLMQPGEHFLANHVLSPLEQSLEKFPCAQKDKAARADKTRSLQCTLHRKR